MTRFQQLSILGLCLFVAVSGVAGCQAGIPVTSTLPPVTFTPSVPAPTTEIVVTHPELEVINPENAGRLQKIDQWGQGNVHGIALSADGSRIAVATPTGIYIYDRSTVEQVDYIGIRMGHQNEPQQCSPSGSLAFSPDGSILAIANVDIMLWDLKGGRIQKVLRNQIEEVDSLITGIQFSSDGSRILGVQKQASGYPCYHGWGSLVVYAVDTGELLLRRDHTRLEEGPGTLFAEQAGTAYISYYNHSTGAFFLKVDLQTGEVLADSLSPTLHSLNHTAAVTYTHVGTGESGYSQAHLVDLISFEDQEIFKRATVELIPHTDRMMIQGQQEFTVRTLEGRVICSKPMQADFTHAFLPRMFSSDGAIAVGWNDYGYRAGDIRIWDLERCTVSEPVLIFPEAARQMNISADGRSLLTGSAAGYTFYVFDVQTGQLRFSLHGFDAQFSADGQQVFVVEEAGVNAYDVETGTYLHPILETHSDYMTSIVVSPDGEFIAINDKLGEGYRMVNIAGDSFPGKLPVSIGAYPRFSRDGKFMALLKGGAAASELQFWELNTGNELSEWHGLVPTEGYIDPSFNADFTRLATYSTDGYYKYIYLWEIPSFSLVNVLTQAFPNGDRFINNFDFIADDRLLFARGVDPDVFLFWDSQTGNLLHEIPAEVHESELGNPLAFSPDGRLLLVLDSDGTIHVWGVK